jgi:hypothetical protein
VISGAWDGVLADNDLATLKWYSPALLAGTTSPSATDAKLRAGLDAMVETVGAQLTSRGKSLVPNISDARLYPGRWALHAQYGGGMEENFAHWGTDPSAGFLWDWAGNGWQAQTAQMDSTGLSLAVTRASAGDRRTLLYGYGSLLVRGGARSVWSPSTTPANNYTVPESIPEMSWRIGRATTTGQRAVNGVWTRTFEAGYVAVNPTQSALQVTVPAGYVDGAGNPVSTVVMGATSAVLLRR